MMVDRRELPTVIEGDGFEDVCKVVRYMMEYGFGRVEITLRDHVVASIDYANKLVRAPLHRPRRTRA